VTAYVRRHHVAFLALFLALGGGGAYAASELSGGDVRGFDATPTNGKSASSGRLASLAGLTLAYRSQRDPDARICRLVARTKGSGELHSHLVTKPSSGASALEESVGDKRFGDGGSYDVATASFDEGAPGISRQTEGQLTWATGNGKHVATAVFHVSAESKRCAFQGTVTAAG
jgi:hypothetical protein